MYSRATVGLLALGVLGLVLFSRPELAAAQAAGITASAGHPVELRLRATTVANPMAWPEGPGAVLPPNAPHNGVPVTTETSGQGVVWLEMRAPGTSWASFRDTAAVVSVSVDAGAAQQIVLFAGASPFTYTGFTTHPLAIGVHRLTIRVDAGLSHTDFSPTVDVMAARLGVVPPSSSQYLAEAFAPVVYGRHSAASRYTPLLVDVSNSAGSSGSRVLRYVLVVSAHDQGDSTVPAYQWAVWGRMTDIVSIVNETIGPRGAVVSADFASCGCGSVPGFPDWLMAPEEATAPIPESAYDGTHPVLRDASATNYLADSGTTPFRFAQAPLQAPVGYHLRTDVMDQHPWTYRISNEELPREHVISTSPDNLLVGDYRQYAIVDYDIDEHGAQDIQFEIRLAGSAKWYSSDYRQMTVGVPSTFPFDDGGHHRTVVKLPMNWAHRAITGFRIRLDTVAGATAPATAHVRSLRLLEVTDHWSVIQRALPSTIYIYAMPSLVPVDVPS